MLIIEGHKNELLDPQGKKDEGVAVKLALILKFNLKSKKRKNILGLID